MNVVKFLSLLWQGGFFDHNALSYYPVGDYEIIDRGVARVGAAADFSGARIYNRTTGEMLSGGVKIDENSSDWRGKMSAVDPKYDNIILHLVINQDTVLINPSRVLLSCQLTPDASLFEFYRRLPISCTSLFASLPTVERTQMLSTLLDERIARKSAEFMDVLLREDNDWNEGCYVNFLYALGAASKDKEELRRVAELVPYGFVGMHYTRPHYIIAAMLGTAGLLDVVEAAADSYTQMLQKEYDRYISAKGHQSIAPRWNKVSVRPTSSPALSMVRAVMVLCEHPDFFDKVLGFESIEEIKAMFDVELPDYWHTHSAPSKGLGGSKARLSEDRVELIIINFVIPMLFVSTTLLDDDRYVRRAERFYNEIKAESFAMLRKWRSEYWQPTSSFDSQALVQLNNEYCKRDRCAECPLGRGEIAKKWQELSAK